MTLRPLLLALLVAASAAAAQPDPGGGTMPAAAAAEARATPLPAPTVDLPDAPAVPELSELLWVARPLVIFADSDLDPRYIQQMIRIEDGMGELAEREVVVLTDTDPAAQGPLRRDLRPRGFGVVLIDIDGRVALRHPSPMPARDIIALIDRMPSRRDETGSRRP